VLAIRLLKKSVYLFCWIWFIFFALPGKLFQVPTSTLLFSNAGVFLGGTIAEDGQWRFPETKNVPFKLSQSICYFEDEYFRYHLGVNPISMARALWQNIKKNKIHSGGSTLTMQTIRLYKKNSKRTYWQKINEIILATRLELRYNKSKILKLYASHAPFGGNVVGIDAAAWRYFKRLPKDLSWAEAATLAVLPNAPSLIYPGKNQVLLLKKRNKLLQKLYNHNIISSSSLALAMEEQLPQKPNDLPNEAPHLLQFIQKKQPGKRVESTINANLQKQVNEITNKHHRQLALQDINNIAVITIEIATGNILAYVGNSNDKENQNSNKVDIVQAKRSSGSILKPFLYQKMIDEGTLLPNMLLPDIPFKNIQNFYKEYEGAVPANEALARSLNLPAVNLLKDFGVAKFQNLLQSYGFNQFNKPAEHYGLSLIIGGGEITLYELAQAYTNFTRNLILPKEGFLEIGYENLKKRNSQERIPIAPISTYLTIKALQEVQRPASELGWQNFVANPNVAWKTGTSHGFRDAWAVGMNSKYAVAVWCGNADGEGKPGLTGTKIAAPLMFDIFNILPKAAPFVLPKFASIQIATCKESGYRMSEYCTNKINLTLPKKAINAAICPYHFPIHLDSSLQFQVNSDCYSMAQIQTKNYFVLPPQMATFYQRKHPFYLPLPPYFPDCTQANNQSIISLVYPTDFAQIKIPINFRGEFESVVFEAMHANSSATLYWHIDDKFYISTAETHKIEIQPTQGQHELLITDQWGNSIKKQFTIKN